MRWVWTIGANVTLWMLLASLSIATGACAGRGGLEGRTTYRGPASTFRVGRIGDDWRRVDVGRQPGFAFSQDGLGAVIEVHVACRADLDIPLVALTNQLLFGFTDREYLAQETVPMDHRAAQRTHIRAKLDGVERELLLYVLKKDGCVYDFVLSARPGAPFDRARTDFDRLVAGFQTGEARS